jgi:hypothetical protein
MTIGTFDSLCRMSGLLLIQYRGNPERLPIGNETTRLAGSGIYYHFDYVGAPRDYKCADDPSLLH